MGKGEIACYEQFLLIPQCFQKAYFPEASKGVIVWEWVNPFPKRQILYSCKLREFADNHFKSDENGGKFLRRVENTVGKGLLLVTNNFSFSLSAIQDLYSRHVKSRNCSGKG